MSGTKRVDVDIRSLSKHSIDLQPLKIRLTPI
jgi:hypothetical protein